MTEKPSLDPRIKLALDFGPLLLFFLVWWRFDIFVATGVFMVAVVAALIVSYMQTGRLPMMLVASAVVVVVFGSLTLVLQDKTFIMVKPTIIYGLFGAVLLAGYLFDKPFLTVVLDSPRRAGAS
jgi:intracellular septation protein